MSDEKKEEHPLEGSVVMVPKAGPQLVFIAAESAAALVNTLTKTAHERDLWVERDMARYQEETADRKEARAEYSAYLRMAKEHMARQSHALESIAGSLITLCRHAAGVTVRKTTRKGAKKRKAVRK